MKRQVLCCSYHVYTVVYRYIIQLQSLNTYVFGEFDVNGNFTENVVLTLQKSIYVLIFK